MVENFYAITITTLDNTTIRSKPDNYGVIPKSTHNELIKSHITNEKSEKTVEINFFNNIIITQDANNITTTASFEIPLNENLTDEARDFNSFIDSFIPNLIRCGDYVEIDFFLYSYYDKESYHKSDGFFKGWITEIETNDRTITYKCEDYSYWFKKAEVNMARQSISMRELLSILVNNTNQLLPNFVEKLTFETDVDVNIINFNAKRATVAEILLLLQEKYLQKSVIIKNKLVVGNNYNKLETKLKNGFQTRVISDLNWGPYINEIYDYVFTNSIPVWFINNTSKLEYNPLHIDKQIIRATNKSNLKYNNINDKRYVINVKNFRKDGSIRELKLKTKNGAGGDSDLGEERSFHFIGDYNFDELANLTENQLSRIIYDGFNESNIETLFYAIKPNDIILVDMLLKNGETYEQFKSKLEKKLEKKKITLVEDAYYIVDAVTTTFNNKILRQNIKFGYKIPCDSPNTFTKALARQYDFIVINETQKLNLSVISKEYEASHSSASNKTTKNTKVDENRYIKAYNDAVQVHKSYIDEMYKILNTKTEVELFKVKNFITYKQKSFVLEYNLAINKDLFNDKNIRNTNQLLKYSLVRLNELLNKEAIAWKNIKTQANLCKLNKVTITKITSQQRAYQLESLCSYKDLEIRNGR